MIAIEAQRTQGTKATEIKHCVPCEKRCVPCGKKSSTAMIAIDRTAAADRRRSGRKERKGLKRLK